jgi:hypothetical protein
MLESNISTASECQVRSQNLIDPLQQDGKGDAEPQRQKTSNPVEGCRRSAQKMRQVRAPGCVYGIWIRLKCGDCLYKLI